MAQVQTVRNAFRVEVADALTGWRLGCISPRPNSSFERAIFIAGLGEILALRLQIAYAPLLTGLQRIEDPYAPPPKRQGIRQIRV